MNKHELRRKLKSTGTAYLLCIFVFGTHYLYLRKYVLQLLFWLTAGGLGIWFLVDLFTMSSKVDAANAHIYDELDKLEKRERDDDMARNVAMIKAASSK